MSTATTSSPTTSESAFFTPSPTPTDSGGGGGGGGGFGNNSTPLYLFTFLATLFVLLFVSCAIVLRSFIIRRRYRRQIEEAIATGAMIPPPPGTFGGSGRRQREFGEKPKLWDVEARNGKGLSWNVVLPVSAYIPPSPTKLASSSASSTSSDDESHHRVSRFTALFHPFAHRRAHSSLSSPSTPIPLSPTSSSQVIDAKLINAERVDVSVVIQFPNPRRPRYRRGRACREEASSIELESSPIKGKGRSLDSGYSDEEDEEMPDVALGFAKVPLRHNMDDSFSFGLPPKGLQ
ncbi:hypothetical protein C8Q75DRAFT_776628 [Abortiporus biennis]|nr:hypothetical protein C8Q75DRAFT_776628 [Abortiporus biennis]